MNENEQSALLNILAVLGTLAVCLMLVTNAKADVKSACQADYLANCAHTIPFSMTCKACMRSAGYNGGLSAQCISALQSAGMISQRDYAKYEKHK